MNILILTPEKKLYEGKVLSVQFIGKIVFFQILEHHTSMVISLNEGDFHLHLQLKKQEKSIHLCLKDGILAVKNSIVNILVNS